MKRLISKLNSYGNSFNAFEPSVARMMLGVFLFFMGVNFFSHTELILDLLEPTEIVTARLFIAHYVIMAHIAGGLLIAFGLITRIAALVQLPIIIGAVGANVISDNWPGVALSSVVLAFIIFYIIIGSSRISVDYNLKMHL